MNPEEILSFKKLKRLAFCFFLVGVLLLSNPLIAESKLQLNEGENGNFIERSLESLRDLDYQTWQLVVYPQVGQRESIVLRVVGYPGTLRIDHPTNLQVDSGRKQWFLSDKTLLNVDLPSKSSKTCFKIFELSFNARDEGEFEFLEGEANNFKGGNL